jgi:hypothetical protein
MIHRRRYATFAQLIACTSLLLTLAACGGARAEVAPSAAPEDSPQAIAASPIASITGIDQTQLDVCAMLPRDKVEAAIGELTKPPQKSLAIGNEVGCEYVVDQGRAYEITIYNLDRWDLIPQMFDDITAVPGIGDAAYSTKEVGGTALYVLLRDRAVVAARVNGANTEPFRRLLSLALAQVPEQGF